MESSDAREGGQRAILLTLIGSNEAVCPVILYALCG